MMTVGRSSYEVHTYIPHRHPPKPKMEIFIHTQTHILTQRKTVVMTPNQTQAFTRSFIFPCEIQGIKQRKPITINHKLISNLLSPLGAQFICDTQN